jgi:hypothetical protein
MGFSRAAGTGYGSSAHIALLRDLTSVEISATQIISAPCADKFALHTEKARRAVWAEQTVMGIQVLLRRVCSLWPMERLYPLLRRIRPTWLNVHLASLMVQIPCVHF